MDMTRKFLQMGMTRARRYANHKGGRKYSPGENGVKEVLDGNADGWKGSGGWKDKDESSRVFQEVLSRARTFKGYQVKKASFQKMQGDWDRQRKAELRRGGRKTLGAT